MGRHKEFDRTDILTKAMELFWKDGYHATSMQDLVNHLGIHRASIYDAFGNKKEFYEEAFALYQERNIKFLTHFLAGQNDRKTGLRKLFISILDEEIQDEHHKGCFVVNCIGEYLPRNMEFLGEILENKKAFEQIILNFLKRDDFKSEINPNLNLKSYVSFLHTFFSGLRVISKIVHNRSELIYNIDMALSQLDVN